ncbi:MAG: FAD-dependent oxidoreductase [Gemmatimonadaceae bacterium]
MSVRSADSTITTGGIRRRYRRHRRKQPARLPKPIPRSDGRFRVARAFFVATLPSVVVTGSTDLPQEFDVVCLGGGVAGEAIAVGLRDSGLTLAVVERELVGGECPYGGCVPSNSRQKRRCKAPHDSDVFYRNRWRSQ